MTSQWETVICRLLSSYHQHYCSHQLDHQIIGFGFALFHSFGQLFCHMHTLFCTHFKGKPKKNLIFDANLQTDLLAVMIMDFYQFVFSISSRFLCLNLLSLVTSYVVLIILVCTPYLSCTLTVSFCLIPLIQFVYPCLCPVFMSYH